MISSDIFWYHRGTAIKRKPIEVSVCLLRAMGCRDNYQLTWADYHPSVSAALQSIRTRSELLDVTLVTANGGEMRAHRLILAACSPVLRELFRRHPDQSLLFLFKAVFRIRVPRFFIFIFPFRIRASFFGVQDRYLPIRVGTKNMVPGYLGLGRFFSKLFFFLCALF